MRMPLSRIACLACALLAMATAPAFATAVTYTDLTSWQNATVSGFSTIGFESTTVKSYSSGLVIDTSDNEAIFQAFNPGPVSIAAGTSGMFNFGTGKNLYWGDGPNYLTITLANAVTSLGFDIMDAGATGIRFSANLNGDGSNTYLSGPTSNGVRVPSFFGFTSDVPISSIKLFIPPNGGDYAIIDNVRIGQAAAAVQPPGGDDTPQDAPEACTALMIASGLIVMGKYRKSRAQMAWRKI